MKTNLPVIGFGLLASILSAGGLLAADAADQPPAPDTRTVNGSSANWKVTVDRVWRYTRARNNPWNSNQYLEPSAYAEGKFNLILALRFEYTGPAADVPAPKIAVIDDQGNAWEAIGNLQTSSDDIEYLPWLITLARTEPDKRTLKGGESFGRDEPIHFYIAGIPEAGAATGLRLRFADVPPIPVEPYCVLEQSLFQRILDRHLSESAVTALLGPGRLSNRPDIAANVRELVWSEGPISITIQFTDGKASGGSSTHLP